MFNFVKIRGNLSKKAISLYGAIADNNPKLQTT